MKSGKLVEFLKQGQFVIPYYLFQLKDKFTISFEEFIFLIYLSNLGVKSVFDPETISRDLHITLEQIMIMIDHLSEQKYISVDVIKNEKGIMEEYVVLDLFYEKVAMLLMEEMNHNDQLDKINIFEKIEQEFARPITSIEYEIIKAWLENGISEELVLEALKEAVFNGVTNLRYIDKILYEWTKKGIKTSDDVSKYQLKHRETKKESKKLELFEYDWFDEEE
ncbi:MAG: DnaD domain protein [bacterium]|nr:DnaD domain protein [bacterium]